tara:strand:- start:31 stop:396 length:366 start_codon:yes stop_codon:yes gene_type:complete
MAKAKKKQQKEINIIEEIFPKSKMKELESLVAEMVKAAAEVVEEYKDDDDIGEAISEMSSSLGQISGSDVIQIHEDSPFLDEVWKGDAWKSIIKSGAPQPPQTEEDEMAEEADNSDSDASE